MYSVQQCATPGWKQTWQHASVSTAICRAVTQESACCCARRLKRVSMTSRTGGTWQIPVQQGHGRCRFEATLSQRHHICRVLFLCAHILRCFSHQHDHRSPITSSHAWRPQVRYHGQHASAGGLVLRVCSCPDQVCKDSRKAAPASGSPDDTVNTRRTGQATTVSW